MIQIFTTGGTIDKVYFDASSEYKIGDPTIPRIFEDVGVEVGYELVSVMRKDSLELTDEDRAEIKARCIASKHKQILITHGTDTMCETAECLVCPELADKVIVLTGAMAPARFRVTDAVFNLGLAMGALGAMGTASAEMSSGVGQTGVFIAMSGQVFRAGKVWKNRELGKFESRD